jgi:membrane protein implicated in regulation of membrane protease activity
MAGVGVVVLLWLVGTAALLGCLLFWLVFPGSYGFAFLMILLVVGLLFVDRQARRQETDDRQGPDRQSGVFHCRIETSGRVRRIAFHVRRAMGARSAGHDSAVEQDGV